MLISPKYKENISKTAFLFAEMLSKYSFDQPIFLCVGNSNVVGDMFGPMCGHILKNVLKLKYVYGDFSTNITSLNINEVYAEIKSKFPTKPIIVVDSALSDISEVGYVKFLGYGCIPAYTKNQQIMGNFSVLANVNVVGLNNILFLKTVRYDMVKTMANFACSAIAEGLKISRIIKNSPNKVGRANSCIISV